MSLPEFDLKALDGSPLGRDLFEGRVVLVVNVASRCGLTPQYEALEQLQKRHGGDAFTVLGVPCNQFKGQEPGTAEEIQEFCSTTYGVTFPLTEKLEVNGPGRHPLFEWLTQQPAIGEPEAPIDQVAWNFEKFLITREGEVAARFRPAVTPDSDEVVTAIEAALT